MFGDRAPGAFHIGDYTKRDSVAAFNRLFFFLLNLMPVYQPGLQHVLHSSGSLCVAGQSLGMKPMGSAKLSSSKRPGPDPSAEPLETAVPEARPSQ